MVICLERGADLHTAQLMPLPLTVSCSSTIQIGLTFLVVTEKGLLHRCVCVYITSLYTSLPVPRARGVYSLSRWEGNRGPACV